ncbi:hypothetical protein GGR53DRAFT_471962 [Hypoxylon sp. FL1150]|nr:hypothetical protein GGR53DRAFT_471962 [Hypoxylon sp. FL1150]
MSPTIDFATRQAQACHFVQSIAKSHGYVGEEVLSRIDADFRRQIEEALFTKDEMIGTSVITLAKNLYSKDVRFIFELLQNADDNLFTRTTSLRVEPYVSFHVYEDKIVVDCNEDGFNEDNIRAICNVGKSSKTGAQGYIGEKGIGFKSVFKVAWKVEIQSGAYSFSFTHRKGNSGFGMISPEWFWPTEELATPLTRTTLFLHHDSDADGGSAQRQNILDQLEELQPAMLLFLKKLRRIEIKVYDKEDHRVTSSTSLTVHQSEANRRILEKVHTENGHTQSTKQRYHIVESTAQNLPPNENREYSAQEESSRAYSTAPVVLAFPLSEEDSPVIEQQELFAFLPVRQVGFNFLIHSDFVTLANREDIMTTSSRNIRLLDALADAFVVGMRGLCQHPTLKYQWMRYLPKLADFPWGAFWQRLVDKIKEHISSENILILRDSTTLARISHARRLASSHIDQHNQPLFNDLTGRCARYISPDYQEEDLNILQQYGLAWLYHQEFLDRVKMDLSHMSLTSRLRTITDDEWHTRVARQLNISFLEGWPDQIALTRKLKLVPLISGKWVDIFRSVNGVYFATSSNGNLIPSDLGYSLVDPAATALRERKRLFTNLGIKHIHDDDIRGAILRKYESKPNINLEISLCHLSFLHLTHTKDTSLLAYPDIWLYDTSGELHHSRNHTFYFKDTSAYGLWALLGKAKISSIGPNIHFLHEKYEEPVGNVNREEWKQWLGRLGIHTYPRLIKITGTSLESRLTEECQFVAKHLPSDLLGFLRYSSLNGGISLASNEGLDELKALEAPCQGGSMVPLSETYLPLSTLMKRRDEFLRHGETFPFLDLGDSLGEASQWNFLQELGVGTEPDLQFYLKLLVNTNEDPVDPSRIPQLYLRLQSECDNSNDTIRQQNEATVRTFIDYNWLVFIPPYEELCSSWSIPEDCLLDAPAQMKTKHSILPRYRTSFSRSNIDLSRLKKFFGNVLGVPKCSWEHIVDELTHMRATKDSEKAVDMYAELKKMRLSDTSVKDLQNAFESGNDGLVFANDKWYKPSQCLWSSTSTPIRGRVNLSDIYEPDFEKFFVDVLGVRRVDAHLVYSELLELEPSEASVEHVKDLIWNLNALLEIQTPEFTRLPPLPLRFDGKSFSALSSCEFAILDRKALGAIFYDKITILDFKVQEIYQLMSFIKWAGLEGRYLSRLVTETSTLDSDYKLPISDVSQDVSRKAYGLYRIATHFKSHRIQQSGQALYDILRASRTWETRRIQSTLSVTVGNISVEETVDRGDIHIDDADDVLQIYVPRDEELRYGSYLSILPKRLVHWMMTDPAAKERQDIDSDALRLVQGVLQARASFVNQYLDEQGTIDGSIPEVEESPTLVSDPAIAMPATPQRSSPYLSGDSSSEDEYTEQETPATDLTSLGSPGPRLVANRTPFPRQSFSPDPFITSPNERLELATREYRALLLQVASAAKKSHLLSRPLDLADLADALGDNSTSNMKTFYEYDLFGAIKHLQRDFKVGAAGELFVFELLSAMDPSLRDFTRSNWRSTMRKYATAHPDYVDMSSWTGIETSDLEYEDKDGALTEVLIAKGYLQNTWRARRPKFYIEVKTTPGSWNTPFYMSHAQYGKMRSLSTANSIYVIFRVFNLYTGEIGCKIFIDPAKLEEKGQLVFTADKWTVRPQ